MNSGSGGSVAAADDIGSVFYQRVKLSVGADGTAVDAIPVSNGLDTTATGVQAVGLVAHFDDTSPGTVTENQFAPVRISSRRALLVEGVASGTAVIVDGSAVTQPVSHAALTELAAAINGSSQMDVNIAASNASVTVAQATAANLNCTEASAASIATNTSNAATSLGVMDDWDNAASDGCSVSGDVAHDSIDAGEPVKIGGRADTTFQTAVADADRVAALFDVYGAQFMRPDHPNKWSYHDDDVSAVTTDGTVQSAPAAGFSVYITDISFSIGAATASSIFLEESTTKILGPWYLEAIAGRSLHIRFATPKKCTAATAILVTNTGATTFSVDIHGFIAP